MIHWFVKAEGVELMLLIIKQKKFGTANAFKVLDYGLSDCPAACERFVDVLGMLSVRALGYILFDKSYKT